MTKARKLGQNFLNGEGESSAMEYLLSSPLSLLQYVIWKALFAGFFLLLIGFFSIMLIQIQTITFFRHVLTIRHFGNIESVFLLLILFLDGVFLSVLPKTKYKYFSGARILYSFVVYSLLFVLFKTVYSVNSIIADFTNITHVLFYSALIAESLNMIGTLIAFSTSIKKIDMRDELINKRFVFNAALFYLFASCCMGIFYLINIII
jgi:ABC-type Na+ efflux pump permease subunit